jgi:hypothetical protein
MGILEVAAITGGRRSGRVGDGDGGTYSSR